MTEYKVYRLLNGDEVMGSVIHENDNCAIIEDPFIIDYHYNVKSGRTNVTMTRYMPFSANNSIEIKREHITSDNVASKDAVDYYLDVLVQWGDDGVVYNKEEEDPVDKIVKETKEFTDKINEVLDIVQPNANTSIH